jgi:hypothetical protein
LSCKRATRMAGGRRLRYQPQLSQFGEKSATRVCRLNFSARPVGWSLLWEAVPRGFPHWTQTAVESLASVRRIITAATEVSPVTFDRYLMVDVHP